MRDLSAEMPGTVARVRNIWRNLYGEQGLAAFEWTTHYVNGPAEPMREPIMLITPWVFVTTPHGWSSITGGRHHGGVDGMRGVIATDSYHLVAPALQLFEIGPFRIARGTTLERVLPVPRQVLDAPMRTVPLAR